VSPGFVNINPGVIKPPEIIYYRYMKLVGEIRFKIKALVTLYSV